MLSVAANVTTVLISWLRSLGLESLWPAFETEGIDAEALVSVFRKTLAIYNKHVFWLVPSLFVLPTVVCLQAVLSDEDIKSLGVLRVGDRAKVCESLKVRHSWAIGSTHVGHRNDRFENTV